jgi:hypothetical protein
MVLPRTLVQPGDLIAAAHGQLSGDAAAVDALERGRQARLLVPARVADDKVAPGGERVAEVGLDDRGVGVVGQQQPAWATATSSLST